jgi:hypothetical protein
MKLAEEPFLTSASIMAALRPSELPSVEGPIRTLRSHGAVSPGVKVHLRQPGGHFAGHLQIYSVLSADAARAFRLGQGDAARKLARFAAKLERSLAARQILKAITALSAAIPADALAPDSPPALRRYARLRSRMTWADVEHGALTREWLSQSSAWMQLNGEFDGDLADAVETLSDKSSEARAKVFGEVRNVSTFYGIVRRLDSSAAELESGEGEALLVRRDELERQGLATIGQGVSLLQEVLPAGGVYSMPFPAVILEKPDFGKPRSPWRPDDPTKSFDLDELGKRDTAWLERELAREPRAVPATALPLPLA